MRKVLCVCCTLVLLLTVAACDVPFSLEPETEPVSAERTFVITSKVAQGLEALPDGVDWQDNAICAVEYLGTRSTYAGKLQNLQNAFFSEADSASFASLPKVDVGGSDVYLVVPRFEMETISVFAVAVDSEGKTHILRQVTELPDSFLLFCTSSVKPNAQLSIALSENDKRISAVVNRDAETGALDVPAVIQTIS